MKRQFTLLIFLFAMLLLACKDNEPTYDYASGLVGTYEINYVVEDKKSNTFLGTDTTAPNNAKLIFIKKDNYTLTGQVIIDDAQVKLNETFDAYVRQDTDTTDYLKIPGAVPDYKYYFSTGNMTTSLNVYKDKKVVGQFSYTTKDGFRAIILKY